MRALSGMTALVDRPKGSCEWKASSRWDTYRRPCRSTPSLSLSRAPGKVSMTPCCSNYMFISGQCGSSNPANLQSADA